MKAKRTKVTSNKKIKERKKLKINEKNGDERGKNKRNRK